MLIINWKGKVGYGDIVSPICYAHNVSNKLDTDVKLVFHWPHGPEHTIDPSDPETLHYRADFIKSRCVKARVSVEHRFFSLLPRNFNHDNYDFTDDLHNFWYSSEFNAGTCSNKIVVNGTHLNTLSLTEYGKPWKDPIGQQGWENFVGKLADKYEVIAVSYRTPVEKLFAHLMTCKAFVGYHGTAAWVAKFTACPMIVFSQNTRLSQTSFGGAAVKTAMEDDFIDSIDTYIKHSCKRNHDLRRRYLKYQLPQSLVSSFTWN